MYDKIDVVIFAQKVKSKSPHPGDLHLDFHSIFETAYAVLTKKYTRFL